MVPFSKERLFEGRIIFSRPGRNTKGTPVLLFKRHGF